MKGLINVGQIRNLYVEAKLLDEHFVQGDWGKIYSIKCLGFRCFRGDNFAVEGFDAVPAYNEYAVEENN